MHRKRVQLLYADTVKGQRNDGAAKRSQDKATGIQTRKGSLSVKSRKAAEKKEDKSNHKEVEAKKKIKPQSSVPPENDKPSIGPSKPVQPKKVAQSSPYQMGGTASSVMSIKS